MMKLLSTLCALVASTASAFAVAGDECETQRAFYPKDWNDVSKDKILFTCLSHYAGAMRVTLGDADKAGRRLMSIVPLKGYPDDIAQDTAKETYRMWLDREQANRLVQGRYFATVVRQQSSCWIRGALAGETKEDPVFLLDTVEPKPDETHEGSGSFYNKAPRLSAFQGDAYDCKPGNK
jgi:hypothetical protein